MGPGPRVFGLPPLRRSDDKERVHRVKSHGGEVTLVTSRVSVSVVTRLGRPALGTPFHLVSPTRRTRPEGLGGRVSYLLESDTDDSRGGVSSR